ncbi:MAG: MarR family transcriptional regulator [Bacteroidota bacterium]|jgi:DNA-binding MarR family transcriptional regulator|nr:MarR family transcriptional regulator [Bacteroidota bacterium]
MEHPELYRKAERLADLTLGLVACCHNKQEEIAERANLSVSEFKCLRAFRRDTEMSVKDIAHRMNLTSSRLTRIIDGLVKKRFVTRHIDPDDRRIINVRLTKQGETIAKKVTSDCIHIYEQVLGIVNAREHDRIIESIGELADALRIKTEFVEDYS